MHEMPALNKRSYANTSYNTGTLVTGWDGKSYGETVGNIRENQLFESTQPSAVGFGPATVKGPEELERQQVEEVMNEDSRRMVRVVIVDPDKRIDCENAVLYDSGEKVTDATDEELFFESGIDGKLKSHNQYREKTLDKQATKKSDKDVYLEPIRIRDLSMQVIETAAF